MKSAISFFKDWAFRLRHMRWFNAQPAIRPMSVAEHGYYTALLCLAIADNCGEPVHRDKLLAAALLHDLEEAYTGDVNTLMKQRLGLEWRAAWRGEAERVVAEMLPPALNWFTDWQGAKADTLEGQILTLADYLAMLLYAEEELGMGNTSMAEVMFRLRQEFLAPLQHTLPSWASPWLQAVGVYRVCPLCGCQEGSFHKAGCSVEAELNRRGGFKPLIFQFGGLDVTLEGLTGEGGSQVSEDVPLSLCCDERHAHCCPHAKGDRCSTFGCGHSEPVDPVD